MNKQYSVENLSDCESSASGTESDSNLFKKSKEGFASKFFNKLNDNFQNIAQNMKFGRNGQTSLENDDDFPDGSCFHRILKSDSSFLESNKELFIKKCHYIGSFPVTGIDECERTDFVWRELKKMQDSVRKSSVLVVVSLSGVKVFSSDGKQVLMAHALQRIPFATCDPSYCQFTFLAREPNGHYNLQYCHSFLTQDGETAEQLSGVVGTAFRMAYAQQLRGAHLNGPPQSEPDQCSAKSGTSSPLILGSTSLMATCRDGAAASSRTSWAKKLVGREKHSDPLVNNAIELSRRTRSGPSNDQSAMGASFNGAAAPSNIDFPHNLGSPTPSISSEDNNSPTDVNSCKQMRDKPPMRKSVDLAPASSSRPVRNRAERPSSGGYINEEVPFENVAMHRSSRVNDSVVNVERYSSRRNSRQISDSHSHAHAIDEEVIPEPSSSHSRRSSRSSSGHSVSLSAAVSETSMIGEHFGRESGNRIERGSHSSSCSSHTSTTPPPPPERHDSLCTVVSEERDLRGAPWFQAGIPREIALEVLSREPPGSFMVRESTSKPGCFALSLRVSTPLSTTGITHYLIMRTTRGYKIKGFTKEFSSLTSLITHHSVMPELLPCPLSLARYNPTYRRHDRGDMVDINDGSNYNLLANFRRVLSDINV